LYKLVYKEKIVAFMRLVEMLGYFSDAEAAWLMVFASASFLCFGFMKDVGFISAHWLLKS